MPKQQVTIEVDVPEGWVFDRYGLPKGGEHWIDGAGKLNRAGFDYQDTACVIVRKAWQWPEWLTAPWIAMDSGGTWWVFNSEPKESVERPYCWKCNGQMRVLHEPKHFEWSLAFTPPPCTDWRQSKRRRPM